MARKPLNMKRIGWLVLLAAVVTLGQYYLIPTSEETRSGSSTTSTGTLTVAEAQSRRLSGVMLTADGNVSKELPDDREGSQHQRFIIKLENGSTLLVAHNIDLAPRVPVSRGDHITVHGQYEWNDRGGVLHWTHHDPAGRHEDGWIEHGGERFQ